jgi:hypothetical protein
LSTGDRIWEASAWSIADNGPDILDLEFVWRTASSSPGEDSTPAQDEWLLEKVRASSLRQTVGDYNSPAPTTSFVLKAMLKRFQSEPEASLEYTIVGLNVNISYVPKAKRMGSHGKEKC